MRGRHCLNHRLVISSHLSAPLRRLRKVCRLLRAQIRSEHALQFAGQTDPLLALFTIPLQLPACTFPTSLAIPPPLHKQLLKTSNPRTVRPGRTTLTSILATQFTLRRLLTYKIGLYLRLRALSGSSSSLPLLESIVVILAIAISCRQVVVLVPLLCDLAALTSAHRLFLWEWRISVAFGHWDISLQALLD